MARALVSLQALTLSGCQGITGRYLHNIIRQNPELRILGLGACPGIHTEALVRFPGQCTGIKTVDLSHNPNVTDEVLRQLARHCHRLESLYIQYCIFVTDIGVQNLALEVNHDTFSCIDLSGCTLLSDNSVICLGQMCHNLKRLNLKAVYRVTAEGARIVTHSLWNLEYLCFEDLYGLLDEVFVFDFTFDGRRAVQGKMLHCVTDINLRDCNKITDSSVNHIMKRAAKITDLNLSGCCKLTDKACGFIAEDDVTFARRGLFLTSLNLAFCLNLTDEGMRCLSASLTRLRCINLAGCVQLTDKGVYTLVSTCTMLQNVVLAQCKQLTDMSLCYLTDFLWVEILDLSYCSKITDDGVEVVALEFSGLHRLKLSYCFRLTARTVDVLRKYCPHLETLEFTHVRPCGQSGINQLNYE